MEKVNIFDQIDRNKRNSLLLATIVFAILFSLVYIISMIFAPGFSFFVLIFAFVMIFLYTYASYQYGDKVVLSATGAKPVEDERKYTHLINVVEGLSIAAGIPKPKIYVIDSDEINAFATGRDPEHASVAVTRGALESLDRDELEGVVGHELSHVKNFDIRFAMIVAVLVGLVAIISDMLLRSWRFGGRREENERGIGLLILVGFVLAIISPIIVRLVQLAISRRREYLADASGAQLTRYPDGLADALEKIKKYNEGKMKVSEAVSHIFFADPNKSPLDNLFATHPPIEERIKILREM
jgi:heat shock protein HtpX